jgi:cytosine/adenosine deaminase-related metal-dependent hydrolase
MFLEGKGELIKSLRKINEFYEKYKPSSFNSLPSTLVNLPKCSKTILVHNTFTSQKDISWVKEYTKHAFWCLCPNANLYIEDKLPDINLLNSNDLKICLGTDSFASNKNLSILDEIKTISNNFDIELSELLKWATINGAEALDLQSEIGSFENGKTPGINLIENIDFKNMKLKSDSNIKVIL